MIFQWAESVVDGLRGTNGKIEKLLDNVFSNHSSKKETSEEVCTL